MAYFSLRHSFKEIYLVNEQYSSPWRRYFLDIQCNSLIVLDSSTRLQLHNNTAKKFGGGIYVAAAWNPFNCLVISIGSTNQYTIKFAGNRAYESGQNWYGVIPENCDPPPFNGKGYEVIRTFGEVGSKCNQTVISSDAFQVVPCEGFCVNISSEAKNQHLPPLYPGQDFSLTVAAIGQDDGLAPAIILFRSNDIFFLSQSPNMTKSIKAQCTTVTQKLELKTFTSEAIVSITLHNDYLL